MKRLFLITCLALSAALPGAADPVLDAFVAKVAASSVSFDYTYKATLSVSLTGSGSATVQGRCFILKGDGLEVLCDSTTRWSLDFTAKEALVETIASDRDYAGNPALLVSCIKDAFTEAGASDGRFQGRSCHSVTLIPVEGAGVSLVTLHFDSKGSLLGAYIKASDGTQTEFSIKNMQFASRRPAGDFTFDTSGLDPSWVITDLR